MTVDNQIIVPTGTHAEGRIGILIRPGLRSPGAELRVPFAQMILASGQVVNLPGTPEEPGAVANINVQLAPRSDVLLDIGTPIEIVFDRPPLMDSAAIAAAVRHTSRLDLTQFKSASQCRPVPATPSTDPTIIPGTDPTPATPPIVIPAVPACPTR